MGVSTVFWKVQVEMESESKRGEAGCKTKAAFEITIEEKIDST